MPRAFLIQQKSKAKMAKADSTVDVTSGNNSEGRFHCEILRTPFGVSKEVTCIPVNTPAEDCSNSVKNNNTMLENEVCSTTRADALNSPVYSSISGDEDDEELLSINNNNNAPDKRYQLPPQLPTYKYGTSAMDTVNVEITSSKIHLSEVKVEKNTVNNENKLPQKISNWLTSCDDEHSKTRKRTHGNYSILDPIQSTKRTRLVENEKSSSIDLRTQDSVHNAKSPLYSSDYTCKGTKTFLPASNKSFQYKKKELNGHTIGVHSPSPPQKSLKNSFDENRKSSEKRSQSREHRRTRPSLPYPYWSPLKIEVPQFEPSPVQFMNPSHLQQMQHESYRMCLSPSARSNVTSSPNERPLFADTIRHNNRDRVSESGRDTPPSEKSESITSDQEMYRDSDFSCSDGEHSQKHPMREVKQETGHYKTQYDRTLHNYTSPIGYPNGTPSALHTPTMSHSANSKLRLHDPHFWQNNIPNIPVDYSRKLTHLQMSPEQAHLQQEPIAYPFIPMHPHYLGYLNAMEKGMFPFMPTIWRPHSELMAPPPFIVNPAFMDARYLQQYQAEVLKCQSPVFPRKHMTPSPPPLKENLIDVQQPHIKFNEHIKVVDRPESLESIASDKLSMVSDDSSTTIDTVISSKTIHNKSSSSKYHCEWCSKTYSTFSGLAKHKQFHCSKQITKQFNCQHCNKEYTSLGALKMHIRTHTLPCKCNICGKAFSRPWLLQGHIRTHTGEKPFSCQHCSRAFADRSNLRAHLQTHSDVKKYSCEKCNKTFSRMSLLLKHKENGCMGPSHV